MLQPGRSFGFRFVFIDLISEGRTDLIVVRLKAVLHLSKATVCSTLPILGLNWGMLY